MSTECLAFVESNTSGTGRLFAREAAKLGLRPLLFASEPGRYPFADEDGIDVVQIDTHDVQEVLRGCRQLMGRGARLCGVISSSEYFIETAAWAARELGLPGPAPDAIRRCRDKSSQRARLSEYHVLIPRFYAVSSVQGALRAAAECGPPVVLKPAHGSGSVGVRLCRDQGDVAEHAHQLLARRTNERGMPIPPEILVEEYVVGEEYSVETFEDKVVGITRKHLGSLPHFVEIGHDYPAAIPDPKKALITAQVTAALKALDLRWGPAHCEVRCCDGRTFIIEVNPRLAGGYIPELVRLAHGIDIITQTINAALGLMPVLEPLVSNYASIRFIIPNSEGVLKAVRGVEEARNLPGVVDVRLYGPVGTAIRLHGDFRDRIGHVIATGTAADSARQAAEAAQALVQYTTKV
jgi:biotin carboxylase